MRWAQRPSICVAVSAAIRFASLGAASEVQAAESAAVRAVEAAAVARGSREPDLVLWETRSHVDYGSTSEHVGQVEQPAEEYTDDITAWSGMRTKDAEKQSLSPARQTCTDCFLVVGVKTRVVEGFQSRQLIRATWANPQYTQKLNTRVVFLACEPDPQRYEDINATRNALALEKQVYGDLLTHELGGCVDSYFRLVDKVVGFYHWVSLSHPATSYVMTADDDVYVRLDRVVDMLRDEATPRVRYYAGQVTSVQSGRFLTTKRDPKHKNYVSEDDYPLSVHCPRAIGAHYLLSMDLVQFISANRHDLRGVGTVEDLTIGFWLLALLQVHPVHLGDFDTVTLNVCRKSLVSYGELSQHAIQQIHTNLVRGEPVCRGFLWGVWTNEGAKEPKSAVVAPEDDFTYNWDFHLEAITRAFRIDITVYVPQMALTLPRISFSPSVESTFYFCDNFYEKMSRAHQDLPPLRCDDLLNNLRTFLSKPPSINAALYALTKSNLPPLPGPSAEVNVWLSKNVVRWRAFIESLMGAMYPDFTTFVFDENALPETKWLRDLSFAVVNADSLSSLPDFPQSCRLIILEMFPLASTYPFSAQHRGHGAVWLRFSRVGDGIHFEAPNLSPLYVPLVSMVFSDSLVHSPMALLQPSSKRKPDFSPIERFAVLHCNSRTHSLLTELQDTTASHSCTADKSSSIETNNDTDHDTMSESTSETIFAFDADVARYTQAKFTMAIETQQSTPGYIGETIAAAFLAGSVPVYDGDDATVSQLFNPKAFINCSRFASLRDCAEYIKQVDRSHVLCEAMRSEPPVVNETAFYEVFSWHPDVLQRLRRETQSDFQKVDMIERLRDMINSV